MFPCPVAGHHVAVLSSLAVEFLVRHVVDVSLKVGTSENVFDHFARVPVPDVVLCGLPLHGASRFEERPLILKADIFPPDVAKLDCVNLPVEVFMVGDGWRVTVRNECCGPKLKELVNLSL